MLKLKTLCKFMLCFQKTITFTNEKNTSPILSTMKLAQVCVYNRLRCANTTNKNYYLCQHNTTKLGIIKKMFPYQNP